MILTKILAKNCFSGILLAVIFYFCVKLKNAFVSQTMQDREISTKNFYPQVYAGLSATFSKNGFPTIFDGHLQFLNFSVKRKNVFIAQTVPDKAIWTIFIQGILRVISLFLPKIVFLPFLAAILNFYVYLKNTFISGTV